MGSFEEKLANLPSIVLDQDNRSAVIMEDLKNKKLTLEEAKELVAHIDTIKYDDEAAHSEEDGLRAWFIECCATGLYTKKEMIEVGKIVLSTKDLDFARL